MSIITQCSDCNRPLRVPAELVGQRVKCPACGLTFTAQEVSPAVPDHLVGGPPPLPQEPPRDRSDDESARPRRRSQRLLDDEDDHDDDYDEPPRRRGDPKPGHVTAIGVMMLVGGILAILGSTGLVLGSAFVCCIWPGVYYGLVVGILATIKGSQLLGADADRLAPPKGVAIMQIINIVNLDVVNCVLGIIALTFLSERETQRYFRGQ